MLNRGAISARLLPLGSKADDDLTACTTAEERLRLVADLTREMWSLAKLEVPAYSRSEMPVKVLFRCNPGE
ncbi:MAG: hypothetical protein ACSLFK_12030 [Gemmatimonadaceae bacterium]